MNRTRKIREARRRQHDLSDWNQTALMLPVEKLQERSYVWYKTPTHPWNTQAIREISHGYDRKMILEGLLSVYESWKSQLEEFEQAYYLKIWLFEGDICQSQVVCAIGDKISHYETVFMPFDAAPPAMDVDFSEVNKRLDAYSWEPYANGNFYLQDELEDCDETELQEIRQHSVPVELMDRSGGSVPARFVKTGLVWVGEYLH